MSTILLLGLENDLANDLARVLRTTGHHIETAGSLEAAMRNRSADIIFAGGDAPDYRETVRQLVARRPDASLVLVNRLPENMRWLEALELGAADYCGAPFETTQVRWIIDSVLRRSAAPAAVAA